MISINPKIAVNYMRRGHAKEELNDYQGAISDYNKGIALDPNNSLYYSMRFSAKKSIGDLDSGCSDLKIASSLGYEPAANIFKYTCQK